MLEATDEKTASYPIGSNALRVPAFERLRKK